MFQLAYDFHKNIDVYQSYVSSFWRKTLLLSGVYYKISH